MPFVKVVFSMSRTVGRQVFSPPGSRISEVVLAGREAEPRFVHGEANSATMLKKLGVVLHHALESRWRLEGRTLGVGILRIDELRNDSPCLSQVGNVLG